jgi:hypothetical protein
MNLFWFLYYLHLSLDCDTPILEACWIVSDRLTQEATRIFPRIKYQLLLWNYLRNPSVDFGFYRNTGNGDYRTLVLTLPFTFLITVDKTDKQHSFSTSLSYPRNLYKHREFIHPFDRVDRNYESRGAWISALFKLLQPVTEASPFHFLLDFNDTTRRMLWVVDHNKKSNWIEIE